MRVELNSLTRDELEEFFITINEKKYRGNQLFDFFHNKKDTNLGNISVFSKDLKEKIEDNGQINEVKVFKRFDSSIDVTKKYLFNLHDNHLIEGVLMKYKVGYTACISTQVGCKMGCSFCASTKGGFIRNLTPFEMLAQIYLMEKDQKINISRIVLMGSGEPLDNYDNVIKFFHIIHDEKGKNLSYRNITLSTCGLVPRIYDLAKEDLPINLAISLHSPFNHIRENMMPIGGKYLVEDIIKACKYYYDLTKRRITFEYTLIEGVNNREIDALELIRLLKGLNCHINLIPLNITPEYNKERASKENLLKFKEKLEYNNISTTIRREMGKDINASCGQLRNKYINQ